MATHFPLRLLTAAGLFTAGLTACEQIVLPGGYSVFLGDRGKSWLQNPDGTMAHPTVIHRLYRDERRLVLIASVITYGGVAAPPLPLDETCEIALLVDTKTQRTTQIRLAEANLLAAAMRPVEITDRHCREGM